MSEKCRRCKGWKHVRDDDNPDTILSCPDCYGTGEAPELSFDVEEMSDDEIEEAFDRRNGKD